jgi:predicted double-glycine peptidase
LTTRAALRLVIAAATLTAAMPVPPAPAQAPAAQLHLLDVPYLPQTELLCGGAAIAMVMRYWGATNVYAETFADLVDAAAGGIHGGDLVKALRDRGWDADSISGDAGRVQAFLSARQPIVALIEDRPGRFHYVVVVGWSGGRVIVHDPARAPFRVLEEKSFLQAWRASDNWTLVAKPSRLAATGTVPDGVAASAVADGPPRADAEGTCGGLISEGVRLAGADDKPGAQRLFEIAAANCPNAAGPWREMAGLHALDQEWPAAARDARRALSKDPHDTLAARILATALFLDDDTTGALEAWNRVGEPVIDLINVTGLDRTRYTVATRIMGLDPQTVLTPGSFTAARRRVAELPSAQGTRVTIRPGANGRTLVDASIIERPVLPTSPVALTAIGLRALTDREAAIAIASPTGGGEAWTASWRWWQHRPRLAFGFDSASPFGGVWGVSIFGERQSYQTAAAVTEETRQRAEFHVSNWTTFGLRWEGTIALDRIGDPNVESRRRALALAGALQERFANDRALVEIRAGSWAGQIDAWTLTLRSEWRSKARNEGSVALARIEESVVASDAPVALWPGAGTGQGRDGLLRAHPLLDNGIIRDAVFGRTLIDGGVEGRHWIQPARTPVRLAPALFVDVARAYRGLEPENERWQIDVGTGVRVAIPGSGVLRFDVAHGLRDGGTAFSMGWGR